MKKYDINEFVKLCNEAESYGEKKRHDSSYRLGLGIEKARAAGRNVEKTNSFSDCNNVNFYNSLVNRAKPEGGYEFIRQPGLIADNIDPFKPFYMDEVLDQKWHILISVLAYLDTAGNADDKYGKKMDKKFNYGQLKQVEVDEEKKRFRVIGHDRTTRWYTSGPLNEWIIENVVKKSENDSK